MDLIRAYLDDIGTVPLLTAEEEVALAKRVEAGALAAEELDAGGRRTPTQRRRLLAAVRDGERAKQEFVTANLRLVVSIARGYRRPGVELADLVQEGNLGLLRAVERFDWRLGFKFSSYASWWIRQAIQRSSSGTGHTIHLPAHRAAEMRSLHRRRSDMRVALGREPTIDDLAAVTGMSPERIVETMGLPDLVVSLSEVIAEDGTELGDLVPDQLTPKPDGEAINRWTNTELARHLEALPERQAMVLRARFGLNGEPPLSLQQLATRLGVTRERIRQIEKQALKALQRELQPLKLGAESAA
jgi:RNA polymerase primary sigma factor/RNA polymerase nonessential primary-like sigma factor